MAREIAQEDIDSGNLSVDEVLYLQDRGRLPEGITPLEIRYSTGEGVFDPDESDSDDEAEDYVKGWNNERRRAELADRGLSVDGKSGELIARLLESDAESDNEDND